MIGPGSTTLFRRGMVVLLFNPLIAALSALVLVRLGGLLALPRRVGLMAAAAWAFGTIAWPYSRTFFTEPLAGLLALVAFEQFLRWGMKPIGMGRIHAVLAGVFLALANWVRVDAPLFTVGLVGAFVVRGGWLFLRDDTWARPGRRLPVVDVLIVGAIALGSWLLLQRFNAMRFGELDLTAGYSAQSEGGKLTTPLLVGLYGLIFSAGKGFLFFSPAVLLGLVGWWRIPAHLRWIRTAALITWTPFFLVMAMWQNWDGGWCWGPRHIIQIHLPIMMGSLFFFVAPWTMARRFLTGLLLAIAAGVQLFGSSQNPLDYYREYFMTYDDMIYHRVNLREMQQAAIADRYVIQWRNPDGSAGQEVNPRLLDLPAPMIDSLYMPEHSQWATYPEMWRIGYCDLYFLNALTGHRNPDRMGVGR